MREENIPLFALESQDPVFMFDFLAITIQYEMCYTNILQVQKKQSFRLHYKLSHKEKEHKYPEYEKLSEEILYGFLHFAYVLYINPSDHNILFHFPRYKTYQKSLQVAPDYKYKVLHQ